LRLLIVHESYPHADSILQVTLAASA
jgi:hypothetical protein